MSIYVKQDNRFEQTDPVARECPHCGATAQLIPISTPSFAELNRSRPRQVALGFRCAACGEPRFARAATRAFGADAVELSSRIVEIERPRERFAFTHLPAPVARLFREALDCYTAHCHLAFATMCRRTLRSAARNAHDLRSLAELYDDAVDLGGIDAATARLLKEVLLGDSEVPEMTPAASAALIEIVKDMLRQRYVRSAKLKAALQMRRHFATAEDSPTVMPFQPRGREAETA